MINAVLNSSIWGGISVYVKARVEHARSRDPCLLSTELNSGRCSCFFAHVHKTGLTISADGIGDVHDAQRIRDGRQRPGAPCQVLPAADFRDRQGALFLCLHVAVGDVDGDLVLMLLMVMMMLMEMMVMVMEAVAAVVDGVDGGVHEDISDGSRWC